MFNWLKETSHDESGKRSSNRTAMYWLLAMCSIAFVFGAIASSCKNKIAADWSINALKWLAGSGGFVGACGQVKSWLVTKTVTPVLPGALPAVPGLPTTSQPAVPNSGITDTGALRKLNPPSGINLQATNTKATT